MKQRMKSLSIATVLSTAILATSGIAHAGDCKDVKFHFMNNLSSKIKVKKVEIGGNDGTWKEDIANKQIHTGNHYTTNGRRMNKLDSGATPSFMKVEYDLWNAPNNRWDAKTKNFTNRQECKDGHTYNFNMQ